jgi:hypothetical protein
MYIRPPGTGGFTMRHFLVLTVILMALVCNLAAAERPVDHRVNIAPQTIFQTGVEDVHPNTACPPGAARGPMRSLDDPISPTYIMGYTFYDNQQNSTFGKQLATDTAGFVQFVWTRGQDSTSATRHVFWNYWDADVQTLYDNSGLQVDGGVNRAGFINIATDRFGFGYPLFHQVVNSGGDAHAAYGSDLTPHSGAFDCHELPHLGQAQIIWPHVATDVNGHLQVAATTTSTVLTDEYAYTARGIPQMHYDPDYNSMVGDSVTWPGGFHQIQDYVPYFVSVDVAASTHSSLVAIVYIDTIPDVGTLRYPNQVYLQLSEDGGLNWAPPIDVSNNPAVDTMCMRNGGTVDVCNQDTLQPWIDCAVFIDRNDVVHVGFTTPSWKGWPDDTSSWGYWQYYSRPSCIWHWDNVNHEFNLVAERRYGDPYLGYTNASTGGMVNQVTCQRPSFAEDTISGKLYCSYQVYDSGQTAASGYPSGDAWVSVSLNNGRDWSQGVNVTNTRTDTMAEAGHCFSERDINLAQYVTTNTEPHILHMQYMLDLDAGTSVLGSGTHPPEGLATWNPMVYQPIPVDLIPDGPLLAAQPFHRDSTGFPTAVTERPTLQPGQFALYQNYPNPFNPNTNIQFDLASESFVSLKIFDVLGREVKVLANNQRLSAGAHVMQFDGAGLASGVYFYTLETPGATKTMKMVLMK